ncbi:MAG TPA: glycerate kinase [Conexibacter sp.]|nr:glycerate kinase [Conexibacter sp.]
MTSIARAPILIAPAAFKGTLRAPEVAAALARGLEAGGWPIDPCPIADGGAGTLEVLLPALGGETAAVEVEGRHVGIGLVEDGGTAILELRSVLDRATESSAPAGKLLLAAAETGAEVLLVGAGDVRTADGGAGAAKALVDGGGVRARVVVLCDVRMSLERAGDGIAGALRDACGARLEHGAAFVLDALDFDMRMRAAHAVIVGEGELDLGTLAGKAPGEAATRARQAGVPCFAAVGARTLDAFGARILDLQLVLEADDAAGLENAGRRLATLV